MRKSKKIPFLALLIPAFLLFSCQTAPERNSEIFNTVDPAAGEILALIDRYGELFEDTQTGRELMTRFREDPALILRALAAADPFQREQMLILVGSRIANARRSDPAAYSEYAAALQRAADLDLDDDLRRMLGFIHANISHWYGQ